MWDVILGCVEHIYQASPNVGWGCELAAVGLGYTSFDLGRLARFASSEILNRPRRLRNESDRALPRDDRDGLSFHRRGEL
jgi:hypothetical protein